MRISVVSPRRFVLRLGLLVLCAPFFTVSLSAQDSMFAFVNVALVHPIAPASAPATAHKFAVAKDVFNQLVKARGDNHKAVPRFVMTKGRQYMAWMNPSRVEIGMEEKIYDVCTSFGADSLSAIAAVLAHELTHYYENHDWSRNFVNNNAKLETSAAISGLADGIKLETQADYLGGMLAIAAGFDSYAILPEFLSRAYAAYGLPEQIPGYPSLADRIQLSSNTASTLKELHAVYRTAEHLTTIGAYDRALNYYEYILQTFQSYEVFNNAGVSALLAALDLMKPGEFPYALPLELDATSRLDRLATRLPDDPAAARTRLLQKARNYLLNATNQTEREAVTLLNMAAYYLLSGKYFDAEFWATKAQRTAIRYRQSQTSGNAQILLGILAALDERPDDAERLFTAALPKSRALAEFNLAVVLGNETAAGVQLSGNDTSERIGSIMLEDLLYDLPELDVNRFLGGTEYCGKKAYRDHTLFLQFADDGEAYAAFQLTKPNYGGATARGIRLGATRAAVLKAYGPASRTLASRKTTRQRYDEHKIVFYFGADDLLEGWMVYAVD